MPSSKRGLALIVTHVDPTTDIGGAEKFVKTLMKVYSSCNLLPILAATTKSMKYYIMKIDTGYILAMPSILMGFVGLISLSVRALRFVLYLIKSITILHVVYCETPIELLIALVAKLLRKRIIVSPLAFIAWLFHHNKLVRLFAFLTTSIKFIITRIADVAHVASPYDKRYVEKVNKNVYLVPHGIEPPPEHIECPEECQQKLRGKIVIGFLGRFTEAKGAMMLLETLYLLIAKHGINAHLLIIGSRHIALQSLLKYGKINPDRYIVVKNHITITGYVNEQRKYALIKCCDIGVIPSLSEPIEAFSYALSEFNASGLFVIASAVGALKTRLMASSGILIKRCKAEEISRAINMMITKKLLYKNKEVKKLPDTITIIEEHQLWKTLLLNLLLNKPR